MKKIYSLLTLAVLATNVLAYDFAAPDANGNTIYYNKLGGDSVEVTRNGTSASYSGDVVVPEIVTDGEKSYRVTTIGNSAFNNCTLNSLSLPLGIQEIKNNAFDNSKIHMEEMNLPNLKELGGNVFSISWYVKRIYMPNLQKLTSGLANFRDCYDLERIILPEEIIVSDNSPYFSFNSCILLKEIKLPSNIKTIPASCFNACWSLKHVYLPDSVESIGEKAFLGCIWLKTITIPSKVKTIGNSFICGIGATAWGGAYGDSRLSSMYYVDGKPVNSATSNQLSSIYFEGLTPPQVTSKTFANIIKENVTCYVPEEALELYLADTLYVQAFARIVGYRLGDSKVDDVTAHTATVKWQHSPDVLEYTIDLYTSDTLFRQYHVDGDGNLIEPQNAPHHIHPIKKDTTYSTDEFYVLTMDGLDEATDYVYTITGTNSAQQQVYHEEGSFRTESTEGFFDAIITETDKPRKIIRNRQIYILRREKIYTLTGQEVK